MDPLQTEFKFFHNLHNPFTIYQFYWRRTVTQCLLLRLGGKRAGRQYDALVRPPRHCATKVTNLRRTNGAFVAFALKDHFVAYKSIDLEDAETIDPAVAALPERVTLQGNLDPLALVAGGRRLDEQIERVLSGFKGRPHIFNLGHGVLPETPVEHVERLVARVRDQRAP